MYKSSTFLGLSELTSIRNSKVSAFQGDFCAVNNYLASNPCHTKRQIYRGDRNSESWISESLATVSSLQDKTVVIVKSGLEYLVCTGLKYLSSSFLFFYFFFKACLHQWSCCIYSLVMHNQHSILVYGISCVARN